VNWTTWTNVTALASASTFTPPGFMGSKTQFYRAISVQ
jgi:hypothetical protein